MGAFDYPTQPHTRRHGPQGYTDVDSYRPWLRDEFSFRCVYCLFREQWGMIRGALGIDHFHPSALEPSAALSYETSCTAVARVIPERDKSACRIRSWL